MKVLIVGGGGREHALAWKLFASARSESVLCAPGNGGTSFLGQNVPILATDVAGLVDAAKREAVDLVVVGPEAPLAAGLVDQLQSAEVKAFGPSQAAAQIEASKAWAKTLMHKHGIPTARAEVVESAAAARTAIKGFGYPAVIKADGLAGGKGVWVASTEAEAEVALAALFEEKSLGAAADRVIIEQHLRGRELSVLAFTDGERLAVMPPARDYKRLGDGDSGPNTGGMGGYTRPVDATPELMDRVEREILHPTLRAMATEGAPFRGVLYAGLMLTADGPRVLEFNCRFGDPEAQIILPLLESDLLEICQSIAEGQFDPGLVRWGGGVTCGVVVAAPGYPGEIGRGGEIDGLEDLAAGVMAFHGGTAWRAENRFFGGGKRSLVVDGGRVVTVVATAPTLPTARELVYENVLAITFDGQQYRTDIGQEAAVPVPLVPAVAAPAEGMRHQMDASTGGTAVCLVGSSTEEHDALRETTELLRGFGIAWNEETLSVYRQPVDAEQRARSMAAQGARVLIAVAGSEPALPGLLAAWSGLPVIAVVHSAGPEGAAEDALRAATAVPDGAPVAVAGLNSRGARTAAWLAAAILRPYDARVAAQYDALRQISVPVNA